MTSFPLFRQRYFTAVLSTGGTGLPSSLHGGGLGVLDGGAGGMDDICAAKAQLLPPPPPPVGGTTLQRPANLRTLDLKSLPREEGPPSETQLRRAKFQFFDKHCSEVAPGLFLSGDTVARNREQLAEHGVTHVMNCVGFVCKEHFKGQLAYRTFFLQGACSSCGAHEWRAANTVMPWNNSGGHAWQQRACIHTRIFTAISMPPLADTPAEDILCVLYDAFDFIHGALTSGGKVLVHCSQVRCFVGTDAVSCSLLLLCMQ